MKRLIKKSLYKIFVSLFVLFYSFVPQSIAIGQVIEEYSQGSAAPIIEEEIPEESLLEEEVVLPEEEVPPVVEQPLVEEIPVIEESIIEEPVVEEPVIEEPTVEPVEVIKEVMSLPATWVLNGDIATTYDVVKLGETYIAPQNSRVRIIFTKLPENPSKLTITEITLTQEEIEATGAISDKAYDITTDMIDGTFEYDLILPNIEENTKVVYVEERKDLLTEVKELSNNVIDEGDTLKVKDLDHFTIYITTYSDSTFSVEKDTYARGDTIYVKAGELNTSKYYKIRLNPVNRTEEAVYSSCFDPLSSSDVLTYNYLLPGVARLGDWEAVLRVHDNPGCTDRDDRVITDNFNVVALPPIANPPLPTEACGLDIALVLDVSGSISESELTQMKNAFISFVDHLSGTPTQFSVTQFSTTATILQGFTSNYDDVKSAINAAGGGGYTNWEDGLNKAWSTYDPRSDKPNLMIFSSDGNPNRRGTTGMSANESEAVAAAVSVANTIKSAGTRILALGIGSDLDTANMIAISGTNVNTGIITSDVITSNFAELAEDLGELASRTCGGTITVKKYIDTTATPGGAGWKYTVSGTSTKDIVTGTDGTANTGKIPAGTYSVVETNMLTGYSYGSAICKDKNGETLGSSITNGWGSIAIDDEDIISCEFINTTNPLTGTIIVHKDVVGPHGEDIYDNQTYSVQLDNGTSQSIGNGGTVTFNDVVAGNHNIYETSLPTGSVLVSITPDSDSGTEGAQVTLAAEQTLDVYVTNRKNLPSIYGHKYKDVNANGVYDSGTDLPLSGWTIYIDSNEDGDWDTGEPKTTTNAQGEYSFLDVTPGLNVVCEEVETGWTQSYPADNNGCHRVTVGNLGAGNAVNENVDFLNYETPSLTVIKEVINDHGGTATIVDFEIKIDGSLITFGAGVTVGDTTTYTAAPSVLPNISYLLSEKDVTGYTEGAWECFNDATGGTVSNPVVLSPGQNVTCTITNNDQSGSIIVKKDVVPNDSTVWDFEITTNMSGAGGPYTINNLSDGSSYGVHSLVAGLYTITETADSNYTTTISCDDDKTAAGNSINVEVGLGEELECTFTNTIKQGKIIVEKQVLPNAHNQTFDFTGEVSGTIGDEGTIEKDLNPGTYTVSESLFSTSGYKLKSIVCDDGQSTNPSTGDIQTGVATFKVEPGETVRCVFTNEMFGSITAHKYHDLNLDKDQDSDEPNLQDWEMNLYSGNDCIEGNYMSKQNTDSAGNAVFYSIVPGQSYSIKETVKDGWTNVTDLCQNFTVTPGEAKQIDFGNIQYGKISGYKYNDLDGDRVWDDGEPALEGWSITASTTLKSLLDTTDENGYYEFNQLLPGDYIVSETNKAGWVQISPLENKCIFNNLKPGDTHECNFGNQAEYFTLDISKSDDADPVSLGDIITYTINWSLSSNVAINNVTITEEFAGNPSSLLIDDIWVNSSINNPGWTQTNPWAYSYSLGNYAPGEHSGTLEIKLKVVNTRPTEVTLPADIENYVQIEGTKSTGGSINDYFIEKTKVSAPITIKAYKIVCTDESQLPNWGTGGPNITADTAQNWVNLHNTCSFVDGWNFQWGDQGSSSSMNPGDNTGGTSDSRWHEFRPTKDGLASVEINTNQVTGFNSLWMREVWNSNYIPFTYNIEGNNSNNVTAEIYCHTDALNYDNLDRIDGIQSGETYYCVAWNVAANPEINIEKSGPEYSVKDTSVTYNYSVTNTGNVPLTGIVVKDDKCSTVDYKSGDDGDNSLENGEEWKYQCSTNITWSDTTPLTNEAEATGNYYQTIVTDTDTFTLYPFTLNKNVILYWDGTGLGTDSLKVEYSDPNTEFTVDILKGNQNVGTVKISESTSQQLWLSQGEYSFCERDLPTGYRNGIENCITYSTESQVYPEWDYINIITFDLSIDKKAPTYAYKGDTITYEYEVKNAGPASVIPVVKDDKCSPVEYKSGDTHNIGKIDPDETWIFSCDYDVKENGGTTITNIATVEDQEGDNWESQEGYLGGDTNPDNNTDTEDVPVRAGSITVCKAILTPDGKVTDGSELPDYNFSVTGLNVETSQGAPAGVLSETSFTTPLKQDRNGFECVTYDNLPIGHFYYGEESYEGPWNEPKYNDSSININSAIYYSGELFDEDHSNDGNRNTIGDGDILLTTSRPDRTLLVVNQYPYSSIQGRKYYDVNINGDFDKEEKNDENRLDGWKIYLFDNNWEYIKSMKTGDDTTPVGNVEKGQYRFENLLPGTYYVCEQSKMGWYQTEPSSGIRHPFNKLYCHTIELEPTENRTEVQFGNYQGSDVKICKKDNYNRALSGWEVVLASEQVQDLTPINVSNASGTDSNSLPAGKYLIEVSGTYRYGNSNMNADAGYSYRPNGIPSGCDCWLSGNTLTSKGLMAWVNDSPVNWGAYNENHIYTYVYEHEGGVINISIRDDQYSDNLNNKNFAFEIYKVEDWGQGTTTAEGCITLKAVPYGEYILDEYLPSDWLNLSGKNVPVQIDEMWEHFTIKNRLNRPVTIEATKIVCDYEEDLPNWGNGHEPITATTAQDWIKEHPTCSIVPEWEFEWGYEGANNPGDEHIGYGGENWNTFTSSVEIDQLQGTRIEVREVLQENYIPFTYGTNGNNSDNESAEFYCNTDVLNYDNWEWLNRPEYGQTYYCVGFNTLKRTDIHGQKWHDLNRNGVRDCQEEETNSFAELLRPVSTVFGIEQEGCVLEPLISDLRIFIDDNGDSKWNEGELSTLTSADPNPQHFGWYWFEDLLPGKYTICEEIPEGWAQTYPGVPAVPQCHTVTLPNDCAAHSENGELRVAIANTVETYCEFDFGNTQESVLYISETNDSWPNILTIGDTFTYIITVRAAKGPVTDVTLINLPSEGFVPQSSTFSAISSIKGALDTSGVIYASPGKWYLGDLDEDEEVTITYKAIVMDVVDPGVYPDLTYAYGLGVTNSIIIALSESSGFPINEGIVNENVVGTQIKVEEEPELDEGEVLGASQTLQLPRTGASGYITLGAILAMITGFILILIKPKKKIATLLLVSGIALGFIFIKPVHKAYAETNPIITVKVEQPETPTQETSFKIGYVSLPIPINTNLEIRCYEESYGVFGPIYNQTSGNCIVEEPIVQSSGTYTFYITVQEVGNPSSLIQSEKVEVVVDLGIPGPLSGYTKVKGACSYTLTFNTANDGRTSKVQIFKSDIQPFKANESTLVKEMGVEPDKQYSYEDPLPNCGKEYFYAIRSVDDYNNVSSLVTDDIVTIVRTPAPITPTEITGEEEGEVAGEETTPEEEKEDESGEVKGDEDVESEDEKEEEKEEDSDTLESFWSDYKYFIIAVLVVALGSGAYKYVRRKK